METDGRFLCTLSCIIIICVDNLQREAPRTGERSYVSNLHYWLRVRRCQLPGSSHLGIEVPFGSTEAQLVERLSSILIELEDVLVTYKIKYIELQVFEC